MLTLDHSTLFYFMLDRDPKPIKKGLTSWASNVDVEFPTKAQSKPGSSKSMITSQSRTLVNNVVISKKVDVPIPHCSASPLSNQFGAFQDEDELFSPEWDAAISSPIRGRGCLTSMVNNLYYYYMLANLSTSIRTLLQLKIPLNLLDHPWDKLVESGRWPIFLKIATRIICFANVSSQLISNLLLKVMTHGPSMT